MASLATNNNTHNDAVTIVIKNLQPCEEKNLPGEWYKRDTKLLFKHCAGGWKFVVHDAPEGNYRFIFKRSSKRNENYEFENMENLTYTKKDKGHLSFNLGTSRGNRQTISLPVAHVNLKDSLLMKLKYKKNFTNATEVEEAWETDVLLKLMKDKNKIVEFDTFKSTLNCSINNDNKKNSGSSSSSSSSTPSDNNNNSFNKDGDARTPPQQPPGNKKRKRDPQNDDDIKDFFFKQSKANEERRSLQIYRQVCCFSP